MNFSSVSRANWWYRFYSVWDFIKGTIMLLVVFVTMIPFDIIAWQLYEAGTWLMVAMVAAIQLGNFAFYIRAIVEWIIFMKQYKKMQEEMKKYDPNVDIIWQVKRPW